MRKTTDADLFDLVSLADITMGQVGHILPLSECLNTKCFLFFSRAGLSCEEVFINTITPGKVIHKKDIVYSVVDDTAFGNISERFNMLWTS